MSTILTNLFVELHKSVVYDFNRFILINITN